MWLWAIKNSLRGGFLEQTNSDVQHSLIFIEKAIIDNCQCPGKSFPNTATYIYYQYIIIWKKM